MPHPRGIWFPATGGSAKQKKSGQWAIPLAGSLFY
jgi:hypothetical protein